MCELQFRVNGCPPTRAPIDFCYVRPNHIPAVNALLQTVFWPGIDSKFKNRILIEVFNVYLKFLSVRVLKLSGFQRSSPLQKLSHRMRIPGT